MHSRGLVRPLTRNLQPLLRVSPIVLRFVLRVRDVVTFLCVCEVISTASLV
eukprot:m.11157 g.11157  ORF g.11157 m.11157 type:complete len:51 (+) comp4402_c0_seq1:3468-3620(+)